jgi:tetratricopeptide (TPR) repeat protein
VRTLTVALKHTARRSPWSSGNYQVAIDQFSKGISLIPSPKSSDESKELSKILYSNRSAALLKEKRIAEALQDANKCIDIDQTWGKGKNSF